MSKTNTYRYNILQVRLLVFLFGLLGVCFQAHSQCPIPIILEAGAAYELTADAGLNNYQWFRDMGTGKIAIAGATNQKYEVTQFGKYSWTANDPFNCPANSCCEVEFQAVCTTLSGLTATATPNNIATGSSSTLNVVGTGIINGTPLATTFNWAGTGGFTSTTKNPNTGNINTQSGYSYTVTASNINATSTCTATATTSLTAITPCTPIGGLTASVSQGTISTGTSATLGSNATSGIVPGTTFFWAGTNGFTANTQNPSTQTFHITGGYSYTVTASNANGTGICTATATTSLSVVSSPCPAAQTICAGDAYRIEAPVVLPNYQWFRDIGNGPVAIIGATNRTYEVTEYGTYTFLSTDISGCPINACCPVEFKACCTIIASLRAQVNPNLLIQGNSATLAATAVAGLDANTKFSWFGASAGSTTTFSSTIQNPNTGILNTIGGYTYTVTAQNIVGSATCTATATTSLTVTTSCIQPSFNARIDPITCIGDVANSDAKLLILQVTGGDKVGFSLGNTYTGAAYATATSIVTPAGQLLATNLPNPISNTQTYTVRVFNQNNTCYRDQTVVLNRTVCTCPVQVCLPFTITRIRN